MRTKWFKQIVIQIVQEHLPNMLFFPKKRGLATKKAVLKFFALFCAFLSPEKAPFPRFSIFYPRFFRQNCAFFEPSIALVTTKQGWVELTPKKHRKRKKHRKGELELLDWGSNAVVIGRGFCGSGF